MVPIDVVVRALAERVEQLVAELLPAGHREGAEWIEAHRAQGGLGDSLRVHLAAPRRGVWNHWGGNARGGDALDLVAYLKFNGDKKKAFAWARHWLGYDASPPPPEERARLAASATQSAQRDADRADRLRRAALRLYLEAHPLTPADAAWRYLAGRGLDLARLPRRLNALRAHPAVHRFAYDARAQRHVPREAWPALIAPIVDARGQTISVQRVFLQVHADGSVTKAALPDGSDAKKCLGGYRGGYIPLWKGTLADGTKGKRFGALVEADAGPIFDPATGEIIAAEHANNSVTIAEGSEDGLSAVLLDPALRVIAGVAVDNFRNLALPAAIRYVTVLGQDDGDNARPQAAIAAAAARWHEEGRTVYAIDPPPGFKDLNDRLQGKKMHEGAA